MRKPRQCADKNQHWAVNCSKISHSYVDVLEQL